MHKINRAIPELFLLFILLTLIQLPCVYAGLKLARDGVIFAGIAHAAASLKIFDLYDKQITITDRTILKGEAPGAEKVTVNDSAMNLDEAGAFKTGLVLQRGKNLIIVTAKWKSGEETRRYRILRLTPFSDTYEKHDGVHWAKKEIVNLATLGVIEGYPDNRFEPQRQVSRGELATWLVRAKGDRGEKPDKDPFFDVPKEHWRAPFIRGAAVKGYMRGYSDDKFGIDDPIARASVAVIIDRAQDLKNESVVKKVFSDVSLNNPSAAAIWRAYMAGLVVGVAKRPRAYEPNRNMTRAELTEVLSRLPRVKRLVSSLFDFGSDYDESRLCKVNTPPQIEWVKISLYEIPRDGETASVVRAKVNDKQGMSDISQVKVDLRSIGGPPDALMYDDGSHGDETAKDGIFSMGIEVSENTDLGVKRLTITALDKSGWETSASTEIKVVKQW